MCEAALGRRLRAPRGLRNASFAAVCQQLLSRAAVATGAAATMSCALVQECYCAASALRSAGAAAMRYAQKRQAVQSMASQLESRVIAIAVFGIPSVLQTARLLFFCWFFLAALAAVTTCARTVGEELTLQSLAVDAACRESQPQRSPPHTAQHTAQSRRWCARSRRSRR